MTAELAFNRSVDVEYGVAEEMAPGVRRIVANNPGPYTFLGSNTYIVGQGEVAVIDPGPADKAHLAAIAEATRGERITHILLTHRHRDHCDGARPLQAALGGEIYAFGIEGKRGNAVIPGMEDYTDFGLQPDRVLADGETVRGAGWALDVIHTPGHARDHLCFALVGQRTVFTGDHVMGWNTTVIAPPEGSLAEFLASMEKLLDRNDKAFLPGHGGQILTPRRVVRAYMMHRKWREQTILACLEEGVNTIAPIVDRLYGGLEPGLKGAAALSVFAHLEYLIERGQVETEGPAGLLSTYLLAETETRRAS
ncbi:MBL fold metallo-hydrolase [Methyloligella sp. 2.7D]|uniref:MBL fold metallo-hydrolase n=1 Tax=unclassified Methyloligella TaxID=2625955 RepID=UPI00157BEB3F|nr:MBL fold metallo-hydrolase [Methyloligella sp. GL2]QKP78251.1 MBL fold metallo-hydrolase [Methyloligella sp. GL2]